MPSIKEWTIVAKPVFEFDQSSAPRFEYFVHVLDINPYPDFCFMFHNRPLKILNVCPQFVFARFTWSVFQLLKPFVSLSPVERKVVRIQRGNSIITWISEKLQRGKLKELYGAGKSRSLSGKRKTRDDMVDDEDYRSEDTSYNSRSEDETEIDSAVEKRTLNWLNEQATVSLEIPENVSPNVTKYPSTRSSQIPNFAATTDAETWSSQSVAMMATY